MCERVRSKGGEGVLMNGCVDREDVVRACVERGMLIGCIANKKMMN